jgi:CheY-like chemotaxis protein
MPEHWEQRLKTLQFLVVEDHEFQRLMLEQTLLDLGAGTVLTASNGAEAMRILRDRDLVVDIVVTDLMMPGVDGIELIPMLRESANPVSVVLSSVNELALQAAVEIARGYGVPVLGVVAKPITPATLRPLLEQYLAARAEHLSGDSDAPAPN